MSKTKERVNVIYFRQGGFYAAKKGSFLKGKSCLNIFSVIIGVLKACLFRRDFGNSSDLLYKGEG